MVNGGNIKMETLKFYDVRTKKSFSTDKYKVVNKKGRKFAVAVNPKSKKKNPYL